jgi:glycosyltransferase involved in cell wall biosynthesis
MTIMIRQSPDYSSSNPYQSMLYGRAADYDIRATAISLGELADLDPASEPDGSILHLHWTNPIVQQHADPVRARRTMRHTLELLDRFRSRGGHFVWTVHNVLPHDHRHHVLEVQLCRELVARADLVHILTPSTLPAVSPYYSLDDSRVITTAHSSFIGNYPDVVTRQDARKALGLAPDDEVLVALGALKPYRGLDRLAHAIQQAQRERPRLRLLVAGQIGHALDENALRRSLDALPGTVSQFDYVPDNEVQLWMRAADVAAMPYERVLNSASLQLALTFGLPVIAPQLGVFHDQRHEEYLHLYRARSTDGLTAAISEALRPDDLAKRSQSARQAAESYKSDNMSHDFLQQLLSALKLIPKTEAHQ